MASNTHFRAALFGGFNKQDVSNYIKRLLAERAELKKKIEEIEHPLISPEHAAKMRELETENERLNEITVSLKLERDSLVNEKGELFSSLNLLESEKSELISSLNSQLNEKTELQASLGALQNEYSGVVSENTVLSKSLSETSSELEAEKSKYSIIAENITQLYFQIE